MNPTVERIRRTQHPRPIEHPPWSLGEHVGSSVAPGCQLLQGTLEAFPEEDGFGDDRERGVLRMGERLVEVRLAAADLLRAQLPELALGDEVQVVAVRVRRGTDDELVALELTHRGRRLRLRTFR
jgi:hypothetical protein